MPRLIWKKTDSPDEDVVFELGDAPAVVGRDASIGPACVLHPHVVLYPGTRLGARVEIHAGSVIGRPGFGYHRDATGRQRRILQVGWVEIEDDVEIGTHCEIDRATFGATRIRRGTKIDKLVQIGHNSDLERGLLHHRAGGYLGQRRDRRPQPPLGPGRRRGPRRSRRRNARRRGT